MIEEVRKHLTEKLIPFWEALRDEENGGYYGYMGYDLDVDKRAEKGCILNSRILWFFSSAYKVLGEKKLLESAAHAYTFFEDFCVDREEGGVYWSVTYDGKPADTTKHTYNQAFAIYGLCAYYEASGDAHALDYAEDLFALIEARMRDRDGYLEAFDRTFHPAGNDKLSENGVEAKRSMNTLLHVMEAYTEYYKLTKDPEVADRLGEILGIVHDRVYNPELRRQEVFFDLAYHSLADVYSYGHDIEAAWLTNRATEILGDPAWKERMDPITAVLADNVYKVAFDGHSLPVESENGVVKQDRVWWVQAEAVNGFLDAYQRDPSRKEYLEAAKSLWAFIRDYVIDHREHSEWLWYVNPDGTPAGEPIVEPWKCPYHNGRMCLEVITRNVV